MRKILLSLVSILMAQSALASYEETSRRYLTNHEIIQALETIIPLAACSKESLAKEGSSLGENTPLTGQPVSPTPGQSTVALITRCLSGSFKFLSWSNPAIVNLVGKEIHETMNRENYAGYWEKYSEQTQKQVIASMVYNILGSDETIKDFDIVEPEALKAKIFEALKKQPNITNMEVVTFVTINLVLRDEFLSY